MERSSLTAQRRRLLYPELVLPTVVSSVLSGLPHLLVYTKMSLSVNVYALQWTGFPSRVYSHLIPSVNRIGFGPTTTLTRIKCLLLIYDE